MAAAFLALQAHIDNKQKRKATAIGVFLSVETQRKFLKVASNVQLDKDITFVIAKFWEMKAEMIGSIKYREHKIGYLYDDLTRERNKLAELRQENKILKEEIRRLKSGPEESTEFDLAGFFDAAIEEAERYS